MTTVIKLKKSETALSKPTTSDLAVGEVAINSLDQRIFVRDSNDNIITIGEAGGLRHESSTVTYEVTVATKDSKHRYNGSGSSSGYKIDGTFSPTIELVPGNTYQFDQSDSTNSGHPLRFYYEADKTTSYTTGVTTNGTPGSTGAYTQIVVSDTTPSVLHYQCSSHAYMGNAVQVNSNKVDTPYRIDVAAGGADITGIVTANKGNVYLEELMYFEAFQAFTAALKIFESENHNEFAAAMHNSIGNVYLQIENYELAESYLKTAQNLYSRLDQSIHNHAIIIMNLAKKSLG